MTEAEIAEWIGLPAGSPVPEVVRTAMADVPVPHTDQEHVAAFRAFLSSGLIPPAPYRDLTPVKHDGSFRSSDTQPPSGRTRAMAQNGNDKEKDEGTYPGQPSSPEKDGKGNGQDKDPRPTR